MKGLLLAGGHGTRLRPLTFTGNKHMLPIANKPMLQHGLEHLRNAGIKDIYIILGPVKEGVVETFGDGSNHGVNITYIDQPEPKGLAHAVMVSEDYLRGEPFVMYLGDNLLKQGVKPFVDLFKESGSDFVGGVAKVNDPSRYGVVAFNTDETIKRIVEKPKEPISEWALIGVYVFNDNVFDALKRIKPSWRGELEITDTIQTLLDQGHKVKVKKVEGWWKDAGKPEDLLEANQLILGDLVPKNEGTIEKDVKISNVLRIGKGTHIREGSVLQGPSIIGENCTIGPQTYIGPYTSIGDGSTIANSEIQNSIVMEGASIECDELITDSVIGRNVVITKNNELPKGKRFIIGDQSKVTI